MHEELVEYEIPSNKSVVNGNLSIEYSPNPHVGDNYNYYIYGPVTYVQPKDEEGKEPTSTPYVLEPSDNGNLHSQTHIDNSSKVCIVDSQKFKIRRFHLLLGACMLVLVATTIGLTAYHLTSSGPSAIDNDDDSSIKIVKRAEWFAENSTAELEKLKILPPPYVIVAHTVSQECNTTDDCKSLVRSTQAYHISLGYGDIGFNFLVGGDGNVYEGLGWDIHGAHCIPFNSRSIGLAFIGDFRYVEPAKEQLNAARRLLEEGLRIKKLDPKYKVFGASQVVATESPGAKLLEIIEKTWLHWAPYDPDVDDD